ncbi:hypothetical protein AWB80_08281 [Caballeronia pedi]|uniref:Uncharacterized protein n=1 Tax=Caballeronia pedi TaxID=1777141 RepID=A0A158E5K7_9BURK|nr:hypothetical protein AWB80_08281 [Caballeronia pedi]
MNTRDEAQDSLRRRCSTRHGGRKLIRVWLTRTWVHGCVYLSVVSLPRVRLPLARARLA